MLTRMLRSPTQGYDIAKRATMEFLDSFAETVDPQDREILRCVARCAAPRFGAPCCCSEHSHIE